MDGDLISLEARVRQAAELCTRLRVENSELRQRLSALEQDNRRLQDKIDAAAARIETLLEPAAG